jgi:hypothetical protein
MTRFVLYRLFGCLLGDRHAGPDASVGTMTGQLSLILSPPDVERVPWPETRRLPLLRNYLHVVAEPSHRRVSRVCQPGYHKGRKPATHKRSRVLQLLRTQAGARRRHVLQGR